MAGNDEFNGPKRPGNPFEEDTLGGPDETMARELLSVFLSDDDSPPEELPDRTIRKVQNELTSRDLIDLTTFVFLMRFCAPLLDLIAAFFGVESENPNDRRNDLE